MFTPLKGRKETDEASPGGGFEKQMEFQAGIWLFLEAQLHLMLVKLPNFQCSSAFPLQILFIQSQCSSSPSPCAAFQCPLLGFVDIRGQSPIFLLFFQYILTSSVWSRLGLRAQTCSRPKLLFSFKNYYPVLGNLLSKTTFL